MAPMAGSVGASTASAHGITNPQINSPCVNFVSTGGGTCVNPGPVALAPQEQETLSKKSALALEYARVRAGTLSVTTYEHDLQSFMLQYHGSTTTSRTLPATCPVHSTGSVTTGAPATTSTACGANWVNLTQQSQNNWYYCGPATAAEVLGVRGAWYSQSFLAGSSYLKTDANGQTTWNPYVMGPTLNTLLNTSWYVADNGSGVGYGFSQSTWMSDLGFDIDNGWAIAGNIVEYANTDPHLVGHPRSMTISHWIGIYGYTNYGYDTSYADSISGDAYIWPWAVNVPAYSTISSSDMTTLLNQRGFVW